MEVTARVDIGDMLISIRAKDVHAPKVIEALRRAKFKFAGNQKIMRSNKWGFTKYDREVYVKGRKEGWIVNDGVTVKYIPEHGPLTPKNCVNH